MAGLSVVSLTSHMPVPEPDRITAWLVDLPLRQPFSSAVTHLSSRRLIVVRLDLGDAAGWGEAAPVPDHSGDAVESMWESLKRSSADFGLRSPVRGDGMIRAAFAQASTDLAAQAAGQPLWRYLGGTGRVWASAAIGLNTDGQPDDDQISSAAVAGYRHAKLKISERTRIESLASVIARFPSITFGVDANGSMDLDDQSRLALLDDLGLAYIEQPGPADDLTGHRTLRTKLATPVSLDESASSPTAIDRIVAKGAADVINLKVGRFGTAETLALAKKIIAGGCNVRLGGLVESGIGRAHTIALATNEIFATVGDIAGSDRYFTDDLVRPQWRVVDGQLIPPDAPGLGVDVNETAVLRYAIDSLTSG